MLIQMGLPHEKKNTVRLDAWRDACVFEVVFSCWSVHMHLHPWRSYGISTQPCFLVLSLGRFFSPSALVSPHLRTFPPIPMLT